MFGIIPAPLWHRHFESDHLGRIHMVCRVLVIQHHDTTILVDGGISPDLDARVLERHQASFPYGDTAAALQGLGINATDVTHVLLTHLHFDHLPGLFTRAANDWQPLFPHAVHIVQRRQLQWAHNPSSRDKGSFILPGAALSALNLHMLDGRVQLDQYVTILSVDGHTKGLAAVQVQSGAQGLLYPSDVIPTAAHVPSAWLMAYDIEPLLAVEEKRRLLHAAQEGDWWVCFEHDPACAAAKVQYGERDYGVTAWL